MESTVLRIPEYDLQNIKLLDKISFRYWRGNFTSGTNTYATAGTIVVPATGWYLISLSFSSGSTVGCKAQLYNNTTSETVLSIASGSNQYTGGSRTGIHHLTLNESLLVQYGRSSSVGGVASIRGLTTTGILISDDAEV